MKMVKLFLPMLGLLFAASAMAQNAAPAGDAARGKTMWVKYNCYSCHGYDGHGGAGAKVAPKPIAVNAFIALVRHPPASTMPTFTAKVVPDADLRDMWTYLNSLPAPAEVKDVPLLIDLVQGDDNKALVRAYVENQLDTYQWLRRHDVPFLPALEASSGQSVPRVHNVDPADMVRLLASRCRESGKVTVLLETAAERLICDATGKVCGVQARSRAGGGDQQLMIHAKLPVILACGGFGRDKAMVHRFAPQYDNAFFIGGAGNVGDGLMMGWSMGADLLDMPFVNGTFGMVLNRYPEITADPRDEALLRLGIEHCERRDHAAGGLPCERFAKQLHILFPPFSGAAARHVQDFHSTQAASAPLA